MDERNKKPAAIRDISVPLTVIKVLISPYLRITALRCIASILKNFFLLQYRAALNPGIVPVTRVDHPLDNKIPFLPCKVNLYLDFVASWVRSIGFLLRIKKPGRRALESVRYFMESMGSLYAWAAQVYEKNMSTTNRPFYIQNLHFLVIHIADPHLLCIPSLHVMIVIRTYTLMRKIWRDAGDELLFAPQVNELYSGALAITEAVLFIKQHSVNCIPAAMYTMTRFDESLFPPDEAERFAADLFQKTKKPGPADADEIRKHIVSIYRRFLAQGEAAGSDWTKPLLDFLIELPKR